MPDRNGMPVTDEEWTRYMDEGNWKACPGCGTKYGIEATSCRRCGYSWWQPDNSPAAMYERSEAGYERRQPRHNVPSAVFGLAAGAIFIGLVTLGKLLIHLLAR